MFRSAAIAASIVISLGAATLLSGCKIVPIANEQNAESKGFDAKAFAEGLWSTKALPYFGTAAKPLADVQVAIAADINAAGQKFGYRPSTEGSPWSFIVTGTGTVKEKNTQSRAGTLVVTVDGADITLQIGPVVKGNVIRDSLPFVSFKDFTNQIEYADAGKALTALAITPVTAASTSIAIGSKVTFIGAMALNAATDPQLVTPVELSVVK